MLKIFDNPLLRQYFVVVIVNLSLLASGLGIVWPSPVLVKLSNETQTILSSPLTEEQGSWIVSIMFLCGLGANFIVAILVDKVGRKYGLILFCLPRFITGFLFIFATDVWMLLLGRALLGIAETGIFTIVPMYASEVASKEIRGSLGTILQIMCSIGVLIMLSIGPFMSYIPLNVAYTCLVVITTLPLFFLSDSPCFLYSKGKRDEAFKVLTFYRGSEQLAQEEIKEYEIADANIETISKKAILTNRLFIKSLILVSILSLFCQLVGFNAVSFYLQTVLESSQTSVNSDVASGIIGMIQLGASFGTTFMTDKFGRKPILSITSVGMAIGMFGLGVFFKLKENGPVTGVMNYVPLISLILVVYSYSAGLGSLVWVLCAELYDDKSRAIGMSISGFLGGISMFLTTKYFAQATTTIGPAWTYWAFSVNCVILCLFILFCIPETKGKSFAEIQNMLRKKRNDNDKHCKTKC